MLNRETALLHDPSRSSTAAKEKLSSVLAHELVHQWFGNLVTMEFWSDLWLKEGFANYLLYVSLDEVSDGSSESILFELTSIFGQVEPNLQMGQRFTIDQTQKVFAVDSLLSSHAMSMPVKKRNEINGLFDSIPYAKGRRTRK